MRVRAFTTLFLRHIEALRLNPNTPLAHFNLGWALEQKADYADALQEYRRASELDPSNANYRGAIERVAKQVPPTSPVWRAA